MEWSEIVTLMGWRVSKAGNQTYKALPMTPEQMRIRRMELRKLLIGTRWCNAPNDELDNMRLWQAAGDTFIEDAELRQHVRVYYKLEPSKTTDKQKCKA